MISNDLRRVIVMMDVSARKGKAVGETEYRGRGKRGKPRACGNPDHLSLFFFLYLIELLLSPLLLPDFLFYLYGRRQQPPPSYCQFIFHLARSHFSDRFSQVLPLPHPLATTPDSCLRIISHG